MGYTETEENPYADLKGTEWYAPYILQLTAAGILQGDGTNCNAEEPMNRERATVLFARALGIRPTAQPDLSGFVDGKDAADWSAGYIDAMAKDGIIQGVGNQTLALGSSITRGSVVKILDSSVAEYAVEEGATIDQDVDGILLVAADDITVDGAAVSGNLLVAPKAGEANLTVKNARLERDLRVSTHGATLTVADSQVEGDVALSGDRASLTLGSGAQLARLAVDGARQLRVREERRLCGDPDRPRRRQGGQPGAPLTRRRYRPTTWCLTASGPPTWRSPTMWPRPRTVRARRSPAPRTARNPARVAAVPAGAAAPCLRRP